MKRITAFLLGLILFLCLAGCGHQKVYLIDEESIAMTEGPPAIACGSCPNAPGIKVKSNSEVTIDYPKITCTKEKYII